MGSRRVLAGRRRRRLPVCLHSSSKFFTASTSSRRRDAGARRPARRARSCHTFLISFSSAFLCIGATCCSTSTAPHHHRPRHAGCAVAPSSSRRAGRHGLAAWNPPPLQLRARAAGWKHSSWVAARPRRWNTAPRERDRYSQGPGRQKRPGCYLLSLGVTDSAPTRSAGAKSAALAAAGRRRRRWQRCLAGVSPTCSTDAPCSRLE